jgi:hypothetical protein
MTNGIEEKVKQCQVDHLILLVGGNPLPNAVAGCLLAKPGGRISLIHSPGTHKIAEKLQTWLRGKTSATVYLEQVNEAHPSSIRKGVANCLKSVEAGAVGLHYTGGTKAMSVHAFRALEEWARDRKQGFYASYLDARDLRLVYEEYLFDAMQQQIRAGSDGDFYVGDFLRFGLKYDFLKLHGWEWHHSPNQIPLFSETASEITKVTGRWADWKEKFLKTLTLPDGKQQKLNRNKTVGQLKDDPLPLPEGPLQQVAAAMVREISPSSEMSGVIDLGEAVDNGRFWGKSYADKAGAFVEWLDGKWLEHYTLHVLKNLSSKLGLHECWQNVETKDPRFDVDVVAIRGYQLFAFSCGTASNARGEKSELKRKLFEVYFRARQIGGDEARVALICCTDDAIPLENEVRRDIDALQAEGATGRKEKRIRVFGRGDLPDLGQELESWITAQSGKKDV